LIDNLEMSIFSLSDLAARSLALSSLIIALFVGSAYVSQPSQAAPKVFVQNQDQFANALDNFSSSTSFVYISATDATTGNKYSECVFAPFLLGSIAIENGWPTSWDAVPKARKLALQSAGHAYVFHDQTALANLALDYAKDRRRQACEIIKAGSPAFTSMLSGQVFKGEPPKLKEPRFPDLRPTGRSLLLRDAYPALMISPHLSGGIYWMKTPDFSEAQSAMPQDSKNAGRTLWECRIGPTGKLRNCELKAVWPTAQGFDQAAMKLLPSFTVDLTRLLPAKPDDSTSVTFEVDIEDENRRIENIPGQCPYIFCRPPAF
jgi:hypothetical protein